MANVCDKILDMFQKYPTYDKEMYSIVQAYQKRNHYIFGMETIIQTENGPL